MSGLQRIGVVVIGASWIGQLALTVSGLATGRGVADFFLLNVFSLLLATSFLVGEIRKRGPADVPERRRRRLALLGFGAGLAAAVAIPAVLFLALGRDGGDPVAVALAVGLPVALGAAMLAHSQLSGPAGPLAPEAPRRKPSRKRR